MNTNKYGLEYRIDPIYNDKKEVVGNRTVFNKSFLNKRGTRYNPRTNKMEPYNPNGNFYGTK